MKTLNIYTVKERKPKHGEEILWFKTASCLGYEGWEPVFTEVEYHWEDGDSTGLCYAHGDEEDMLKDGWKLLILFDGYVAQEDYQYTTVDEYFEVMGGSE